MPPPLILADTITLFMFLTATRLIIANFIIAFIESIILQRFFKVRRRRLFGWMLLANAFSVIAGGCVLMDLAGLCSEAFSPMVLHFNGLLLFIFILALVISFVMELPFIIAAAGPAEVSWRRALRACAAAQIGSYAILFPLYWLTVYAPDRYNTAVFPTESLDFVKCKSATVLFLPTVGTTVMETRLDGSPARVLLNAQSLNLQGNLTVRKAVDAERWDLWRTTLWNDGNPDVQLEDAFLLQRGITTRFPAFLDGVDNYVDWQPPGQRNWIIDTDRDNFVPEYGMKVTNQVTGKMFQIRFITAFVSWAERCPNILPGDQVVFEISGQIVVMDLNTRKLGFVDYGRSPIVVSTGD